jgi:RNA polymerase sigma-70 factor (ECF subfamily)
VDPELGPIDEDLAALLSSERRRPDPPDAMKQRVRSALRASPSKVPARAWSVAKPAALVLAGVIAGGGVGAYLGARAVPPKVIYVDAPAPQPSIPAPPTPVSAPPAPLGSAPPIAPPPSIRKLPTAQPAPDPEASLRSERILLDRAHAALARGDYAAALEAVALHERTFPSGRLAEEREYAAIRALRGAGRVDEASARAARFRQAFPNSLFLPAIDAALNGPH